MKANLTTVCKSEAQEEIRNFLNRFFKSVAITDAEKSQVVLAIDEAVANAIIHGNNNDSSKKLELDLDINEKRIFIELNDIGVFDKDMREQKVQKDLKEIIKDKQKGGLGLKLIYTIMDIVNFYSMNNKNYLMMVKLIESGKPKEQEGAD
jgi:serine/threonine-protein kinase RsbW